MNYDFSRILGNSGRMGATEGGTSNITCHSCTVVAHLGRAQEQGSGNATYSLDFHFDILIRRHSTLSIFFRSAARFVSRKTQPHTAEFEWNIYDRARIGIIHERCGLMIIIFSFALPTFSESFARFGDDDWWHSGHGRSPNSDVTACVCACGSRCLKVIVLVSATDAPTVSLFFPPFVIHSDSTRMRFVDQIPYQWPLTLPTTARRRHEHAVFYVHQLFIIFIINLSLLAFFFLISLSRSRRGAFGRFTQSITLATTERRWQWTPSH